MTEDRALTAASANLMEKAVIEGDLGALTPQERVAYYARVCDSLGLNPYTKPFDYLRLNNKLVLYARRDCTDQLRRAQGVSITITAREVKGDVYIVTAQARTPQGRTDESTGAVSIKGLAGDFLANAYMKAETKSKRRVTLSICGLGWMDETEVETVGDARVVQVDTKTGEIEELQHTGEVSEPKDLTIAASPPSGSPGDALLAIGPTSPSTPNKPPGAGPAETSPTIPQEVINGTRGDLMQWVKDTWGQPPSKVWQTRGYKAGEDKGSNQEIAEYLVGAWGWPENRRE